MIVITRNENERYDKLKKYINLTFAIRVVGNGVNVMCSYDTLPNFVGDIATQICLKASRCLTDVYETKRRGYVITFFPH